MCKILKCACLQATRAAGGWLSSCLATDKQGVFPPLLLQVCAGSPTLVDCSTLPGVVRIDMLPAAVAKRLSEKALSLLDGPLPASNGGALGMARSASPPRTPK